MRSIVHTGPESVELQEREQPTLEPHEALVRVHTAGICGSDAHAYKYDEGYHWLLMPRVMGHEYSGVVEAVGADVTSLEPGQKVVEEPIHRCGECFQCENGQSNVCQDFSITGMHRHGAYTDYVAVDATYLHEVPDAVPLAHAAITEPTSIAARAVLSQSNVKPGDSVLVEGPGPIGVLTAVIADSVGADVVVSGLGQDGDYRLPLVEALRIDTVNVEDTDIRSVATERTQGGGFDVIFDATGHHAGIQTAVKHVRKGGEVVMVGIPNTESQVRFTDLVRGEVTINTSYGSTWQDFERALGLIESEAVDASKIVDTSFGIEDPSAAFEAFLASKTCKPVFTFASTASGD